MIWQKISQLKKTISLLEDFLARNISNPELDGLILRYRTHIDKYKISLMWETLLLEHTKKLKFYGLENFKRTVNFGYFNWKIELSDKNLRWLIKKNGIVQTLNQFKKINVLEKTLDDFVGNFRQKKFFYRLFLAGLTTELMKTPLYERLADVPENNFGNPWKIERDGVRISQDTLTSLLEVSRFYNYLPQNEPFVAAELGAGYGRVGCVLRKLFPKSTYVIFDIPPALYVAKKYFENLGERVFLAPDFTNFSDIRKDFDQASVALFLPHQLSFLPKKIFDIFLTISSLGEMHPEQISWYFSEIERLTKNIFYTKQWEKSVNNVDDLTIDRASYPIKKNWETLLNDTSLTQQDFFESIYRFPST